MGAGLSRPPGKKINKKLFKAVDDSNLNDIKTLLEDGADVNQVNKAGFSLLHEAARRGGVEIVRLLIEKGAVVHAIDDFGITPLNIASGCGHTEVVRLLIEKGAVVNAKDVAGNTPLNAASRCGHAEVVRLLIDKGVDVNLMNQFGYSPLYSVVSKFNSHISNNVHDVRHFIEMGLLDKKDIIRPHRASYVDLVEIVRLLLENGADVNLTDKNGSTLLILAYSIDEAHRQAVCRLLFEHGLTVNINILFRDYSPLQYAAMNSHNDEIICLLLLGAKPDDRFFGTINEKAVEEVILLKRLLAVLEKLKTADEQVDVRYELYYTLKFENNTIDLTAFSEMLSEFEEKYLQLDKKTSEAGNSSESELNASPQASTSSEGVASLRALIGAKLSFFKLDSSCIPEVLLKEASLKGHIWNNLNNCYQQPIQDDAASPVAASSS